MDLKNYFMKFDIVALCETWGNFADDFDNFLSSYSSFDCVRKKSTSTGRNSGGLCVFVKEWLTQQNVVKRIFPNFKDCVVLLFKGSIFQSIKDIILYFAYVSPQGSRIYDNLPENNGILLIENNLNEIKVEYPDCCFFLAGDLNARTRDFKDFIPRDDLQYVFGDTDYERDDFDIPRRNKDIETFNQFGQSLVNLCCTFNVHIINGRLYDDTDGNYTCTANDGTSVVDYNIASSDLFPRVSYFNVENRDESVHFPLHCQLKFRSSAADNQAPVDLPETPRSKLRIRWKEDRKDIFLLSFREKLANVNTKLTQNTHYYINEAIKIIIGLYTSASATMTKRFTPSKPNDQPPWWDRECQELKQRKYSLLRKFRLSNLNADFRLYKQARKEFKQKFKQNKQLYQKSQQRGTCPGMERSA